MNKEREDRIEKAVFAEFDERAKKANSKVPWKADLRTYPAYVNGPDGETVAQVLGVCNGNGDTIQSSEDNARLISAAPDLLEACKKALVYVVSHDGGTLVLHDMLIEAISKAEGR